MFLSLAFGSLSLFGGQVAGKAVTTVLAVSVRPCRPASGDGVKFCLGIHQPGRGTWDGDRQVKAMS